MADKSDNQAMDVLKLAPQLIQKEIECGFDLTGIIVKYQGVSSMGTNVERYYCGGETGNDMADHEKGTA